MKLYVYDHCPFCVRARMPLGLKGIDAETVFLPNHDEETPISMIGAKMLPILEDADGHMGESLDIVHKLDGLAGPRLFGEDPTPAIADWLRQANSAINTLVIPRTPDPVYPEFRDPEAVAYFTAKKEATFGDFDELRAMTEATIAEVEAALERLVPHLPDPEGASIDDILLFPVLRGLTIVPGLTMPDAVAAYTHRMADRTGLPLVAELRKAA
ncbi:glutaredoxin 2 [Psychromarinibacter sp. S121]|uniref:glutaredoxin 2 n=1 Tax=Psychromarinibacter sp. S121 TaxID=3415127 RepID=UPI003C7B206A